MPELLSERDDFFFRACATRASTRFGKVATGCTAWARRMVLAPASDKPEVLDLAGLDEFLDGSGYVFDGDFRIDTVLTEEFDGVDVECA